MKQISGGVAAPKGFTASGVHCGVKKGKGDGNQPARSGMPEVLADKKDLALIVSEQPCAAAAVYTMNRVKAAPLYVTMDHLENGEAQRKAAQYIVRHNLTVAQSEAYIAKLCDTHQDKPAPSPIFRIKDVRLFFNTLRRSVNLMEASGLHTQYTKEEVEDGVKVTIHISKNSE